MTTEDTPNATPVGEDNGPTEPQAMSLLVIEDERDLRMGLQHNLQAEGFRVLAAETGEEGLAIAAVESPDLVVLDLMLPGIDGFEVLRRMRAPTESGTSPTLNLPVVILSARGQEDDKVKGLELGADDYVAKPFALSELAARIRAVLRRTHAARTVAAAKPVHRFEGLIVDFGRFTVTRDNEERQLSNFESAILRMLIEHQGEVVSRGDLLTEVWGYVHLPTTRTVDNHIARLRKKIEKNPEQPEHVVTVHGLGYRFEAAPDVSST